MITDSQRALVHAAIEHAVTWHDDGPHTVAAALRTASGATVLGLNVFHFTGGPCGEIAALAQHAASRPTDPITDCVAAYGPTGEVISPCGKCRQVLWDVDPAIRCIVRTPNGLEAVTVAELLPHTYDQTAHDRPQRLWLWHGYEAAVRSGAKRQTVRVDDPFRPGPAELRLERPDGSVAALPAEITGVTTVRRDALTEEHARRDGFASPAELQAALDRHYPGLAADAEVDVVDFRLAADG